MGENGPISGVPKVPQPSCPSGTGGMTLALLAEQLAAELLSCGGVGWGWSQEASLEEKGGASLRGLQGQAVGQEIQRTELQRDQAERLSREFLLLLF